MRNPIVDMFKNINKEKNIFITSLLSLIVVFGLVDVLIFGIFNLNSFKSKMENSNQIIVYIETMVPDEVKQLQGKLLNTKGIKTLTYESKEEALKKLQEELSKNSSEEIDILKDFGGEHNQLEDCFYVYLSKDVNIATLKSDLSTYDGISSVHINEEVVEKINKFSNRLDKIILMGSIGLFVVGFILIYNVIAIGMKVRKNDIEEMTENGISKFYVRTTYFLGGLLLIGISSVIAFLGFYRINNFLLSSMNLISSSMEFQKPTRIEFIGIYLMSFIMGFIITFLVSYFTMGRYFKTVKEPKALRVKKERTPIKEKIVKEKPVKEKIVKEKPIREKEKNKNITKINRENKEAIPKRLVERRKPRVSTTSSKRKTKGTDEFFKKHFKKSDDN